MKPEIVAMVAILGIRKPPRIGPGRVNFKVNDINRIKRDSADKLEVGVEVVSGGSKSEGKGSGRAVEESGFREFCPLLGGGISDEISVFLESAFAAEEAVGSGSDGGGFREEEEGSGGREAVRVVVERDEEGAETVVGLRDEAGGFSEVSCLLVGKEGGTDPIVPVFGDGFESDQRFCWDETKNVLQYCFLNLHFSPAYCIFNTIFTSIFSNCFKSFLK